MPDLVLTLSDLVFEEESWWLTEIPDAIFEVLRVHGFADSFSWHGSWSHGGKHKEIGDADPLAPLRAKRRTSFELRSDDRNEGVLRCSWTRRKRTTRLQLRVPATAEDITIRVERLLACAREVLDLPCVKGLTQWAHLWSDEPFPRRRPPRVVVFGPDTCLALLLTPRWHETNKYGQPDKIRALLETPPPDEAEWESTGGLTEIRLPLRRPLSDTLATAHDWLARSSGNTRSPFFNEAGDKRAEGLPPTRGQLWPAGPFITVDMAQAQLGYIEIEAVEDALVEEAIATCAIGEIDGRPLVGWGAVLPSREAALAAWPALEAKGAVAVAYRTEGDRFYNPRPEGWWWLGEPRPPAATQPPN
jgi:hypothetical protein